MAMETPEPLVYMLNWKTQATVARRQRISKLRSESAQEAQQAGGPKMRRLWSYLRQHLRATLSWVIPQDPSFTNPSMITAMYRDNAQRRLCMCAQAVHREQRRHVCRQAGGEATLSSL